MILRSGLGLGVAVAVFGLCGVGAVWMALRLIRDNRAAIIRTLPVLPEQTVRVAEPGELVVSIETPRLATDYRSWVFDVVEHATGRRHVMKYAGPRATGKVSGISTARIPLGRVTLPSADVLTVNVSGLAPTADHSAYRLVLTRPHLLRMALHIVGLVLCGIGALLCLLWGLWLLGIVKAS